MLTTRHVVAEVERLAAESGFGYVQVIVAGGRIVRIDRCVQIKATGVAAKTSCAVAAQAAVEPN